MKESKGCNVLNLKEKRSHIAQILLTLLLLSMPMIYFVQKYDYIHGELYTATMSKVSNQIQGRLDREVLWKNQKDEKNIGMIYTAYYYPQSGSLVCHTTRMHNQDTPPIAAYLVAKEQTATYPAEIIWDGEYDTTLLIFEDIPPETIGSLSCLDVIPKDETVSAAIYDPNKETLKRVRYPLHSR